jgi:hypothetical protein
MLAEEMLTYLQALNEELKAKDMKGEICLYGGAVLCLVFQARPSTKDVDAVFHPANIIREAALHVAERYHLPQDWLNDGVKGFVVHHPREVFVSWSHLTIYAADAEYLLAMKALASRVDGTDNADIRFLIQHLQLSSPDDVFNIIEAYYPQHRIKAATQFFIEEVFDTL